jgi:hypothetical protein
MYAYRACVFIFIALVCTRVFFFYFHYSFIKIHVFLDNSEILGSARIPNGLNDRVYIWIQNSYTIHVGTQYKNVNNEIRVL